MFSARGTNKEKNDARRSPYLVDFAKKKDKSTKKRQWGRRDVKTHLRERLLALRHLGVYVMARIGSGPDIHPSREHGRGHLPVGP